MLEEKDFFVAMREGIARGIWNSLEQGEKVVDRYGRCTVVGHERGEQEGRSKVCV